MVRHQHWWPAASMTAIMALLLSGALVSTPTAAASGLKRCPQDKYWIVVDVKGMSCEKGERVIKRAWKKAPQMPLSSTWSGKVGRWSCNASINPGGSSLMKCRKGSKAVQEYWHG